jgi:Rrf2 family protein
MQITKAAEYGVLGLVALARRPLGDVVMIDVICEEEDVPKSFMGKIFQSLARAGIVRSARGSGGGFSLAKAPLDITALEIIEAVEGPIALQRCLDEEVGCEHSGGCALCSLLAEAQDKVREVFDGTTLADLAGRHIPNGRIRLAQEKSRAIAGSNPVPSLLDTPDLPRAKVTGIELPVEVAPRI